MTIGKKVYCYPEAVFRVRIGFNADPALLVNADPDADPIRMWIRYVCGSRYNGFDKSMRIRIRNTAENC
jgi:hypothetical protein